MRANSILKKAGGAPASGDFDYPLEAAEIELVDLIARFPGTVQQSAADYKPLHLANYVYELAKTFHGFYHEVPVLPTEAGRRAQRPPAAGGRGAPDAGQRAAPAGD